MTTKTLFSVFVGFLVGTIQDVNIGIISLGDIFLGGLLFFYLVAWQSAQEEKETAQ